MTTIQTIREQMKTKEHAMNTAMIIAQSNGKSDLELFEIQYKFETELVELQKQIDAIENGSNEYVVRFARN